MAKPISKVWTTCYSQGELQLIEVQVLLRSGIPRFDIIGLPQNMIREGKDRILSALSFLGVELPAQKILVSLNPGDLLKEGSHFDLPILVGILIALGHLTHLPPQCFLWGELGLDGSIRKSDEILAHLLYANAKNPQLLLSGGRDLPLEFIEPLLECNHIELRHVHDLFQEIDAAASKAKKGNLHSEENEAIEKIWIESSDFNFRWNQLKGSRDQFLFWALMVLGRHHALVEGAPGVGKSSWSYAAKELQPPLPLSKCWQRFRYRAQSNFFVDSIVDLLQAPFESPHHSSSAASIIGGGSNSICAGAITRASGGILFLDEFAEFDRDVLECLREPLDSKTVTIGRRGAISQLDADVQLLAAMNACRCGGYRSTKKCVCSSFQFYSYLGKISGPLKDRFHTHCWWEYQDEDIPRDFTLRNLRIQLIEARKLPCPKFVDVILPQGFTPRRQIKWLEVFTSWCKWFGISEASTFDQERFRQFMERMENQDELKRNRENLSPGTGIGIYGATSA